MTVSPHILELPVAARKGFLGELCLSGGWHIRRVIWLSPIWLCMFMDFLWFAAQTTVVGFAEHVVVERPFQALVLYLLHPDLASVSPEHSRTCLA